MPVIETTEELYSGAMSTALKFVLDKVGETGLEILELCYQDIPSDWVCGKLTDACVLNGHKKPLGCAMGLVMMNGGMGSFWAEPYLNPYIDQGTTKYRVAWTEPSEYAWQDGGPVEEAMYCLALSVPQDFIIGTVGGYGSGKIVHAGDHPDLSDWQLRDLEKQKRSEVYATAVREMTDDARPNDWVVAYNDHEQMNRSLAAGWFMAAIELAEQRSHSARWHRKTGRETT